MKIALSFTLLALAIPFAARADITPACLAAQSCIDAGLATAQTTCITATPACDLNSFASNKTVERFAASAEDIADRAIDLKDCSSKTKKGACNACYRAAQAPLKNRFFGKLFQGLLAQSVILIDEERKTVCGAL